MTSLHKAGHVMVFFIKRLKREFFYHGFEREWERHRGFDTSMGYLLYLAQGMSLASLGRPLFEEGITVTEKHVWNYADPVASFSFTHTRKPTTYRYYNSEDEAKFTIEEENLLNQIVNMATRTRFFKLMYDVSKEDPSVQKAIQDSGLISLQKMGDYFYDNVIKESVRVEFDKAEVERLETKQQERYQEWLDEQERQRRVAKRKKRIRLSIKSLVTACLLFGIAWFGHWAWGGFTKWVHTQDVAYAKEQAAKKVTIQAVVTDKSYTPAEDNSTYVPIGSTIIYMPDNTPAKYHVYLAYRNSTWRSQVDQSFYDKVHVGEKVNLVVQGPQEQIIGMHIANPKH